MTLEQIKNIVGLFVDEPLPVELFVDFYQNSQLVLFHSRYSEKDYDALRKFRTTMGDGNMPMLVVNGTATIPPDFFAFESAYYMLGTDPVRINFVKDYEFDTLIAHAIEYPSSEFPIANIRSNDIRFRPKTVNHVVFTYFTKPVAPTYAVTYARGFPEFDAAGSSEVMWNEAQVVELIAIILQNLNIQVSTNQIKEKIK